MKPSSLLPTRTVLDAELLVEGLRGSDFVPCQLSRSPLPSELGRITLPSLCLDFIDLGPSMTFTGTGSEDCYSFVFVLACPDTAYAFNIDLTHRDGYIGYFPPGKVIDIKTPQGYSTINLTVSIPRFLEAAAFHFPDLPDSALIQSSGSPVDAATLCGMRRLLHYLKDAETIAPGTLAGRAAIRQLEDDLLSNFFAALRNGLDRRAPPLQERSSRRILRFRQARDFLLAHLDCPIRLTDISAETGLSKRGVQNLFHDFLGIEPLTFLRHQRLHAVHRTLRNSHFQTGLIKEVALSNGFWHLGNFARYYKTFFGERPSETLSRDPR